MFPFWALPKEENGNGKKIRHFNVFLLKHFVPNNGIGYKL